MRRVREWAELINTLTQPIQPIYTLWNRNNAQNRTKTPPKKEANEGEWEERTQQQQQQQAHSMTKKN